jgi:hypothetical protein
LLSAADRNALLYYIPVQLELPCLGNLQHLQSDLTVHLFMRISKILSVILSHVSVSLTGNRLYLISCTNIRGLRIMPPRTRLFNGAELRQLSISAGLTLRQVTATLYQVTWCVLRLLLDVIDCRYAG